MMPGRKPKPTDQLGKRALILPKIEKPIYQEMYSFYESLGKKRTLLKVAQQFNKSKAHIDLLSRAFNWRTRVIRHDNVPRDPVVAAVQDRIDESRKNLVAVVHEVVDTLHELMFISQRIKQGKYDEAIQKRQKQLVEALNIWGFEWKNPKDFASLVKTLREIKDFNLEEYNKQASSLHAQQWNVDEFNLVIKEGKPDAIDIKAQA